MYTQKKNTSEKDAKIFKSSLKTKNLLIFLYEYFLVDDAARGKGFAGAAAIL